MRRWISWVRPPILPRSDSRGERVRVARGSIPYSAVTQPRPELRIQPGTPVSMVALHRTRVLPVSMRTEPSAVATKFVVKRTGRRGIGGAASSGRKIQVGCARGAIGA